METQEPWNWDGCGCMCYVSKTIQVYHIKEKKELVPFEIDLDWWKSEDGYEVMKDLIIDAKNFKYMMVMDLNKF